MRWAAVASLVLASGYACGGRSDYFDDRTITGAEAGAGDEAGEGGTSSGGRSGRGGSGTGGRGGTGAGGTGVGGSSGSSDGGSSVGGTSAGFGGVGGVGAFGGGPAGSGGVGGSVSGTGGQPAGAGGVGGAGGTGGRGGTGGVGGTAGISGMGGVGGGSPAECLRCVTTTCESAQVCFDNPTCVEGIICGAGACQGLDGGAAITCWVECFGGDAELAALALDAALCLAENCATACQL